MVDGLQCNRIGAAGQRHVELPVLVIQPAHGEVLCGSRSTDLVDIDPALPIERDGRRVDAEVGAILRRDLKGDFRGQP